MVSHAMSVRKGHQRGQSSEKVERLEDKGGGPAGMRPRPVQMVVNLPVGAAAQTLTSQREA